MIEKIEALVAQAEGHREAIAKALASLQEFHVYFERWEPVGITRCKRTIEAIIKVQEAVRQFQAFFQGPIVALARMKNEHACIELGMLGYIHECADNAAIAVRSYQPMGMDETRTAFQALKGARNSLRIFLSRGQEVVEQINSILPESGTTVEEQPLLLPAPEE